MRFDDLPASAAWRHREAREGTECAFFSPGRLRGHTAAVEDGNAWVVRYEIDVDETTWSTRGARVWSWTTDGDASVDLRTDGDGRWVVDGTARDDLDGCRDVDLESSAMTNLLVVRRRSLGVGDMTEAPAAYVRAGSLRVERLEQHYRRQPDDGARLIYRYRCAAFDVDVELTYDRSGLILDYPGLATRLR
jgi:hypothetical protein